MLWFAWPSISRVKFFCTKWEGTIQGCTAKKIVHHAIFWLMCKPVREVQKKMSDHEKDNLLTSDVKMGLKHKKEFSQ